jgi:hypothetical protein
LNTAVVTPPGTTMPPKRHAPIVDPFVLHVEHDRRQPRAAATGRRRDRQDRAVDA